MSTYTLLPLWLMFVMSCSNPSVGRHDIASKSADKNSIAFQQFDRHQEFDKIYEYVQTRSDSALLVKPVIKKRITREEIIRLFGEPAYKDDNRFTYDLSFSRSEDTWVHSSAFLDFKDNILINYSTFTTWGPMK